MPLRLQADAQCIGVAMSSIAVAVGTGIDHELTWETWSSEHVESRGRQTGRGHPCRLRPKAIPFGNALLSQQPDRLLAQFSCQCLEIFTMEKHGSSSQRI